MELPHLSLHSSADIRLFLETPEGTFRLAPIGPDDVILAQSASIPACDADVVMWVNDHEQRWPVRLVNGTSGTRKRIDTVPRPS